MFLSSERGRRILTVSYSWGAAIVIIGALCKILHVSHANEILLISMTFEACIFFISGFERPFSEYHWEDVFPVLKSKNPLDRPDFATGPGGAHVGGAVVQGADLSNLGGGTIVIGDLSGAKAGDLSGMNVGDFQGMHVGGEQVGMGSPTPGGGPYPTPGGGPYPMPGGGPYPMPGGIPFPVSPPVQQAPPSPQALVDTGMAAMGLNISEKDAEVLAESIKKLNGAAEQISKMADLTDATKSYIDRISVVSQNLEKFSEITGSLGEVSDTLINSCKVISGKKDDDGSDQTPKSYVEHMTKLNDNLSGLNHFYETQLTGIRSQMDTILHINAGLNRIRDLYDSSIVDSASFRNENERMAQLLSQLNQVYSRLLQAMTVNIQTGGYPPPSGQHGYQPPYQGYR